MFRWGFALLLASGTLFSAPTRDGDLQVLLQEMRGYLESVQYQLRNHDVESSLVEERLAEVEKGIRTLREQAGKGEGKGGGERLNTLERRIAALEGAQATLSTDIKQLRTHMNESTARLSVELSSLKSGIAEVLTVLEKPAAATPSPKVVAEADAYVVKKGDSLGKIALEQKIDLKKLKELNQLTGDHIVVGQRLKLR